MSEISIVLVKQIELDKLTDDWALRNSAIKYMPILSAGALYLFSKRFSNVETVLPWQILKRSKSPTFLRGFLLF